MQKAGRLRNSAVPQSLPAYQVYIPEVKQLNVVSVSLGREILAGKYLILHGRGPRFRLGYTG